MDHIKNTSYVLFLLSQKVFESIKIWIIFICYNLLISNIALPHVINQ